MTSHKKNKMGRKNNPSISKRKFSIEKIILGVVLIVLIGSVVLNLNKIIEDRTYSSPAGHITPRITIYNYQGVEVLFNDIAQSDDGIYGSSYHIVNVNKYPVVCDISLLQHSENSTIIRDSESFEVRKKDERSVGFVIPNMSLGSKITFDVSCPELID